MITHFEDAQLQSYSDSDLVEHIESIERNGADPTDHVVQLSPNILAKYMASKCTEDSMGAMQFAGDFGVRVPRILRIVRYQGSELVIMNRIPGDTLEEIWPNLSCFRTIKLAIQLRSYIHAMRLHTSETAGSLISGKCRSFWLEDCFRLPANSSPATISSFIEFWAHIKSFADVMRTGPQPRDGPLTEWIPRTPNVFVFTHHDLAPRNILVDRLGQLHLVDWDYAGWYPKYFEYAAMHNFTPPLTWTWLARVRWKLFTWIAAGRWERERILLERIRNRFTHWGFARADEILYHGAASEVPRHTIATD